jgi:hypothetical protein
LNPKFDGANLSDKIDAGKSYVIFGKQDNTAINLSAIVAGTGGFVINGESARGWSGWSANHYNRALTRH